jgi:hypothetical protein
MNDKNLSADFKAKKDLETAVLQEHIELIHQNKLINEVFNQPNLSPGLVEVLLVHGIQTGTAQGRGLVTEATRLLHTCMNQLDATQGERDEFESLDLRIVMANPAASTSWGSNPQSLPGWSVMQHMIKFVSPDVIWEWKRAFLYLFSIATFRI